MKNWPIILAFLAVAALTVADPQSLRADTSGNLEISAKEALQSKLLNPLQKKEGTRSRFSRAALPPRARRIRILDNSARIDATGQTFVAFAIDESHGPMGGKEVAEDAWLKNTITGCVYPKTGEVMVKRGEAYYAASVIMGVQTPMAPATTCRER